MAVLGVMLAIASAKVGGERHELVKSMVEQENAHSRYVTQDLKHRVAVISLRELRATLPILSSKAGGRKEDAQEGVTVTLTYQSGSLADVEGGNSAPNETPSSSDWSSFYREPVGYEVLDFFYSGVWQQCAVRVRVSGDQQRHPLL